MVDLTLERGPLMLPSLREEVALYPGPPALDGSPSWTLHDPVRNQFFRIGWPAFEILSRWEEGSAEKVAERVRRETTLDPDAEEVEAVAGFLLRNDLLQAKGPQATARLSAKAARMRQNWAMWLLKNYLFLRVPLVRPDRFLAATYPLVAWVYSRGFAIAVGLIGLVGLYLVGRQWDDFTDTFSYFFTLEGVVWFALALTALKVVHEFAHAYTAKRFGCRVPTMGLALLVLWPVLFTDVTEGWKLRSRRQRLAIGSAGVLGELVCCALALCAWGFLPNGPLRSAAFVLATSTWVTTILLNMSPFMRFDGYFVLSDFLETPNLHLRAFALARWWLREVLLGLGEPAPEELPAGRRRFLIAFAFATWVYRFTVFLGIAAFIYSFAIKLAGLALGAIEVAYFLVRPILMEARAWWVLRHRIRFGPRPLATLAAAALLAAALLVPWHSNLQAPALLKSREHADVFTPLEGAQVAALLVKAGERVQKDALLAQLVSPDLEHKIAEAKQEVAILEWQLSAQGVDPSLLARSRVAEQQYQSALAEYRSLMDEKRNLAITAPIAGEVVDLIDGFAVGDWMPAKTRILSIVEPGDVELEAYVYEADLGRIEPGFEAVFYPEADSRHALRAKVATIDRASTRMLSEPYLASKYRGPIAARELKHDELVPDRTIYRVTLLPDDAAVKVARVVRGRVVVRGRPESLLARAWRAVVAVAIRESGV
ncbi:MAG TPA: HlyD family efflux transporter periplasmic adaptor subunit [Alphaproteobacteria bacterium]|nr:HlyD family efflux transporter periplasmic adaptor subunit [Alphaproteobacteria bacterium]